MTPWFDTLTVQDLQNDPAWNIPTGEAGSQLARVVQALARLWHLGQMQECVRNLPLLAEKLEDCGLRREAWIARLEWQARGQHGAGHITRRLYCLNLPISCLRPWRAGCNGRRIFWFQPGFVDLVHGPVQEASRDYSATRRGLWCYSCSDLSEQTVDLVDFFIPQDTEVPHDIR